MVLDRGLAKVVGGPDPAAGLPPDGAPAPPPVRLPDADAAETDAGLRSARYSVSVMLLLAWLHGSQTTRTFP
jgi:hypothetical protein